MSKKNEDKFGSVWDEHSTIGNQNIFGRVIPDGTIISRIETTQYNNAFYEFPAVVIWKLYLNMATEYESKAIAMSTKFKRVSQKVKTKDKKSIYTLEAPCKDDLLAYFKSIIAGFIFSFNTLEAYLNFRIDSFSPTEKDYIDLQQLTKETHTGIIKTKSDLIKECTMDEKFFVIIPYLLKKKSIEYKISSSQKNSFKMFQFIRNELTHPKRLKIRTSVTKDGTFKVSKFWNIITPCFKDKESVQLNFYPATFVTQLIETIEQKFSGK